MEAKVTLGIITSWFFFSLLRDFLCWQQWYISHIPFWIVAEKLLECEKKIECIWCKKWWHTIMIVCHWNFQRDFSPCKKDAKSNLKSTCALNYSSSHLQCNALSLYLSYNILAKNVTHKMILHCERKRLSSFAFLTSDSRW